MRPRIVLASLVLFALVAIPAGAAVPGAEGSYLVGVGAKPRFFMRASMVASRPRKRR